MLFRDLANPRGRFWPWLVTALVLASTVLVEHAEGRIWWCACGQPNLWAGGIWSAHNSQHLVDPYTFSHVLHGMLFFWLLTLNVLMLLCPIDAVKQWQMVH